MPHAYFHTTWPTFNELAGGPDNGYHFLVDSNLDWGQSLVDLKAFLDQHGVSQANVSQYTYTDPAWYGIAYNALAPMHSAPPVFPSRFDPAPGVYVIGATTLQGVMMAEPDNYEWFRHRQPTAKLGHALFVYDVQPRAKFRPGWPNAPRPLRRWMQRLSQKALAAPMCASPISIVPKVG